MKPTREQCAQWAKEAGLTCVGASTKHRGHSWQGYTYAIQALCLQVWKEAQEEVRDEMNRERIR